MASRRMESWPQLAEKYHRPVVVIAQDKLGVRPAVGSARSPTELICMPHSKCSELLIAGGGTGGRRACKSGASPACIPFRFMEAVAEQSGQVQATLIWCSMAAALGQLDLATMNQSNNSHRSPTEFASLVCALCQYVGPPKLLGESGNT